MKNTKLTPQQLQFIKENRFMTVKAIASELQVTKSCIYRNINNLTMVNKKNNGVQRKPYQRPVATYSNETREQLMERILNS
jgi:predicted transcriptional regulator